MTKPFRLKGWHVLAALIGFFGVVIAANGIFLTYAIRTFPGQQVEKSYLQGLHFNEQIAARKRQAQLGWSVEIRKAISSEHFATIDIEFADQNSTGLAGLDVTGELRRPASAREDRTLAFSPMGAGVYRAEAEGVSPGAYDLSIAARSAEGDEFKIVKRVFVQ